MADRVVPVDVRSAIVTWPEGAPRGAVSNFCREHGISRSQFYEIRARARAEGALAAMAPKPRSRPVHHPQAVSLEIEDLAVVVRKELQDAGWGGGPISVRYELLDRGIPAPATSTLARIFTRRGLVTPQPQKRPRSSWRRFEASAVHECWQLDGFEWKLLDGTEFTILQVTDDRSRHPIASRVCEGERAEDAIAVVKSGIERFQVPCRLLTDNGSAFNQDRRGRRTQLCVWLESLGCKPISGRPDHPQTQGKNERAHQTTQRWLRAHPVPETLADAQALLDQFDDEFARHRHQGLGMRTPAQAFAEGPVAVPPLPPEPHVAGSPTRVRQARASATGVVRGWNVYINIDRARAGQTMTLINTGKVINVFDQHGDHIRTVHLETGRRFYGNGKPRGPRPKRSSGLT